MATGNNQWSLSPYILNQLNAYWIEMNAFGQFDPHVIFKKGSDHFRLFCDIEHIPYIFIYKIYKYFEYPNDVLP